MTEKKERNSSIELYRVMLMLGICILHCITLGTKRAHPLAGVLMCCVPGFVFISGWFGVKFSPSKVIKLFGVGLWCALISVGINMLVGANTGRESYMEKVLSLWMNGFWFLNAYVVMMMLAPLVNAVISFKGKAIAYLLPLLLLVFVWSYSCGAPVVHKLNLPSSSGMGSNTALTLLGVYAFARICRVAKVDEWLKGRHLAVIALVCTPLVAIGFGNYHSLASSLLAMACFLWVSRWSLPLTFSRVILALSPSMFAVYLLHSTRYGFGVIERIEELVPLPLIPMALVSGLFVFLCCVLIDAVRRVVCSRVNWHVLTRLDRCYYNLVEFCERRLAC